MLTTEMQQEAKPSHFFHTDPVKMMLLPTQDKTQQVNVSYVFQAADKPVIQKLQSCISNNYYLSQQH